MAAAGFCYYHRFQETSGPRAGPGSRSKEATCAGYSSFSQCLCLATQACRLNSATRRQPCHRRHASEHDSLHAGCGSARRGRRRIITVKGGRDDLDADSATIIDANPKRCSANRFQEEERYTIIAFSGDEAGDAGPAGATRSGAGGADAAAAPRCDEGHRQ